MVTEMTSDLKACNAELKACTAAFRTVPPAFVADFGGRREVEATSGIGYNSVRGCSALAVHSASASPIPSPTSAPPHDADFVSTYGELCTLFNTDDRDVDRLSCLPDSLLRDIVARLPLKDAGRTAVLSRRWSPIWPRQRRAAQLDVDHADPAVFRLDSDRLYGFESRSPDGLLEQIRLQQEGRTRLLPSNHDPSAYTAARAWRPPWFRISRSTPSRRCCSSSRELALVPTPMVALEFLIRPYDPGAGFVDGDCVGVYLDIKEAEHARVNSFAMGLLRRSTRTGPADLRTGVGTMLDAVDASTDPTSSYVMVADQESSHMAAPDAFFRLAKLQDVTRITPTGSTKFLSTMHTRCSVQGHGSDEVTNLSLCAFSMTDVAIKGTLHHEDNTSELLRIILPLEPVKLLSFGTLGMPVLGVF